MMTITSFGKRLGFDLIEHEAANGVHQCEMTAFIPSAPLHMFHDHQLNTLQLTSYYSSANHIGKMIDLDFDPIGNPSQCSAAANTGESATRNRIEVISGVSISSHKLDPTRSSFPYQHRLQNHGLLCR